MWLPDKFTFTFEPNDLGCHAIMSSTASTQRKFFRNTKHSSGREKAEKWAAVEMQDLNEVFKVDFRITKDDSTGNLTAQRNAQERDTAQRNA